MLIHDEIVLKQLSHTPLFSYMTLEEISEAFHGLNAAIRDYERGETLMRAGDKTDYSCLLLKGSANILTVPNFDGDQQIIVRIGPGEMYGEPFNCLSYNAVPIHVEAITNVRVLEIDLREIMRADYRRKLSHQLLCNLAVQLAEKIVVFRNKVEVLSQPKLEMKILMTVKQYAEYQNTLSPLIPFSKTEWGNYLSANRNSIARCIADLETHGQLKVEGKRYTLLDTSHTMFVQRSSASPLNAVHAPVDKENNLESLRKSKPSS